MIRSENANLEEAGASFTADYQTENNYQVTFEARYGDGLPEFYTYKIAVKNAVTKTENELNNLAGSAPDAELYGKYLEGQIGDLKQAITDLEARRDGLKNDIQSSVGNSSDKYDELRAVEKQLNSLSNKLSDGRRLAPK